MEAPVVNPSKEPLMKLTTAIDEPTAAKAPPLINFPTTIASAILYSCWNRLPNSTGIVKTKSCFARFPFVKSFNRILLVRQPEAEPKGSVSAKYSYSIILDIFSFGYLFRHHQKIKV